jgi:hypothetical protein
MLNGSVSGQAAQVLRQRGDQIIELAPTEPALAEDAAGFLKALQRAQVDVLSADDVIHSAIYAAGFPFQRSIVYLQSARGEQEQAEALGRLFERYKRLVPGRLYTVTPSRVKVRQLPGH